jgi:hypothetical protein
MSASIEWVGTDHYPYLISGEEEAPDGQIVETEGHYGLVLANPDGTVIIGSLENLRSLLLRSLVEVETQMRAEGIPLVCECKNPAF